MFVGVRRATEIRGGEELGTESDSSSASATPTVIPLQVPDDLNFVLDGLKGQPPQTRVYNFNVTNAVGAPDGVSKPMLVVNGE